MRSGRGRTRVAAMEPVEQPETPRVGAFARARDTIARLIEQPALPLDTLAADARVSPSQLQREFRRLAGVSPKRFSQMLAKERLLCVLRAGAPVLEASLIAGLSSTSRAQELVLTAEGATPVQVRRGGEGMTLRTALVATDLGRMFAAWTGQGFCALEFVDDTAAIEAALRRLARIWPRAQIESGSAETADRVRAVLRGEGGGAVHVRASHFQLRVWQALMRLPAGRVVSYAGIAAALGLPRAARAVGQAVGSNPVALVIPCHRVIRESGALSGYRWDAARKALLIVREQGATGD